MVEEQTLAEWGECWLREWIDEAGDDVQERETREWLAGHKRSATLDTVVRDWWHQGRDLDAHSERVQTNNDLLLYVHEWHALPIWRRFVVLRSEATPIPEVMLAKFEQWGRRLMALSRRNETGEIPPESELAKFARIRGPLAADEDAAILQALELKGTSERRVSFKKLRETELRRAIASEIAHLRRAKWPWTRIAARLDIKVQAAKDCYYEFVPSGRSKKQADSRQDIDAAMRKMVNAGK